MNQSEYQLLKGLDENPVKIGNEHNSLAIDGLIVDIDGNVVLTDLGRIAIKDYEDYAELSKKDQDAQAAMLPKLKPKPAPDFTLTGSSDLEKDQYHKKEKQSWSEGAQTKKQSLPTKIKEAAKKIIPKKKK